MSDGDQALLEQAAAELGTALVHLREANEAHRRVEVVLDGILRHADWAVAVLDQTERVVLASRAAEARWGLALDRPAAGTHLPPAVHDAVAAGGGPGGDDITVVGIDLDLDGRPSHWLILG